MPSGNSEKLECDVVENPCRKLCLEDEEKGVAKKCHLHFSVRSQNTILWFINILLFAHGIEITSRQVLSVITV